MTSKKTSVEASLSKKFIAYVNDHSENYPDPVAFFDALNQWPEKAVRANTLVTDIDELCAMWGREVERVDWCKDATYFDFEEKIGSTPEHTTGLCYIGDPSAMLAVESVDIARDDFVVDMCAAPGGKSVHALNSLGSKGTLIANDVDPRRAHVLKENLERMVTLVPTEIQPHIEVTTLSAQDLAEKYFEQADVVILDAPCSGEAMMRRSNAARRQWSEKLLLRMSILQKVLLAHATAIVKPSGSIVYSTCTFNEIENGNVIQFGIDDLGLTATSGKDLLKNVQERNGSKIEGIVIHEHGLVLYPHYVRGDGQSVAVLTR